MKLPPESSGWWQHDQEPAEGPQWPAIVALALMALVAALLGASL